MPQVTITLLWKDEKIGSGRSDIFSNYSTLGLIKLVNDYYNNQDSEYFTLEDLGKYVNNIFTYYEDIKCYYAKNCSVYSDVDIFLNFELPCKNYMTVFSNYKNYFQHEDDLVEYINKHIYDDCTIYNVLLSIKARTNKFLSRKETIDEC